MNFPNHQLAMTVLMTPDMANFAGNVHGGTILKLLDQVAYACASRYAGRYVVTLSVDQVTFRQPIHVGELVTFLASVNYTGTTSMEVGIKAGLRQEHHSSTSPSCRSFWYLACQARLIAARRFLIEVFGTEEPNWSGLQPEQITEFVRREASKLQPSSCGQPVTAIRALLRFLVSRGVVPQGLERAVPPVLTWRHSSLPRYITSSEVEGVIGVCNPATPLGLRERAVIVLLAHLGLRAGEVIQLKLDDIDWFEGRLIVRAGKNHRERSLPLSQEVGDVLVSYLRDARLASPHREVFLRWRPPFRPLRSSVTITALVAKALKRAGVKVHRPGAHILRHTLATQMVRQGAAFKEIADILGHLSLASTSVYAKLDLESLSKVAMPWPGGAQ